MQGHHSQHSAVERACGPASVRLIVGDITRISADVIVNAANSRLAGGGGVDGAIHRAGGPAIMAACREIGRCQTGDAVATTAGRLPARYVVHAVAPVWGGGGQGEPEALASAYRRSLEVADGLEAESVAFPSLGTGVYGNPLVPSAEIALRTVQSSLARLTHVRQVTFVLFSQADFEVYRRALETVAAG